MVTAVGHGASGLTAMTTTRLFIPVWLRTQRPTVKTASIRIVTGSIITVVRDADRDGFTEDVDCDDGHASINPGRSETPYNGLDDDCDPTTSDADLDGDGYIAERVGGWDCDDTDPTVNPDAQEIASNLVDENCDGSDRVLSMRDADGDGFSEAMGDCNDNDPLIHPSTNEIPYNARDDDCNAATPDDDLDRDGYRQANDC